MSVGRIVKIFGVLIGFTRRVNFDFAFIVVEAFGNDGNALVYCYIRTLNGDVFYLKRYGSVFAKLIVEVSIINVGSACSYADGNIARYPNFGCVVKIVLLAYATGSGIGCGERADFVLISIGVYVDTNFHSLINVVVVAYFQIGGTCTEEHKLVIEPFNGKRRNEVGKINGR